MIPSQYTSLLQNDDFGLNFSNQIYSVTLTANTDTTLTLPGTAPRFRAVIRSSAAGTFASLNAAASAPAGATFAATTSELIPVNGALCREVKGTDAIHFKTAATGTSVTVALYSVQTI